MLLRDDAAQSSSGLRLRLGLDFLCLRDGARIGCSKRFLVRL